MFAIAFFFLTPAFLLYGGAIYVACIIASAILDCMAAYIHNKAPENPYK